MAPKKPAGDPPGLGIAGSISIPVMNMAAISAAIRILSIMDWPVPLSL